MVHVYNSLIVSTGICTVVHILRNVPHMQNHVWCEISLIYKSVVPDFCPLSFNPLNVAVIQYQMLLKMYYLNIFMMLSTSEFCLMWLLFFIYSH